ncbi:hypothetical protein SNEBB_003289 [Seison nebaliae]|nr:hypothetical protein SNEBB_003289 [Seison nebaliae]
MELSYSPGFVKLLSQHFSQISTDRSPTVHLIGSCKDNSSIQLKNRQRHSISPIKSSRSPPHRHAVSKSTTDIHHAITEKKEEMVLVDKSSKELEETSEQDEDNSWPAPNTVSRLLRKYIRKSPEYILEKNSTDKKPSLSKFSTLKSFDNVSSSSASSITSTTDDDSIGRNELLISKENLKKNKPSSNIFYRHRSTMKAHSFNYDEQLLVNSSSNDNGMTNQLDAYGNASTHYKQNDINNSLKELKPMARVAPTLIKQNALNYQVTKTTSLPTQMSPMKSLINSSKIKDNPIKSKNNNDIIGSQLRPTNSLPSYVKTFYGDTVTSGHDLGQDSIDLIRKNGQVNCDQIDDETLYLSINANRLTEEIEENEESFQFVGQCIKLEKSSIKTGKKKKAKLQLTFSEKEPKIHEYFHVEDEDLQQKDVTNLYNLPTVVTTSHRSKNLNEVLNDIIPTTNTTKVELYEQSSDEENFMKNNPNISHRISDVEHERKRNLSLEIKRLKNNGNFDEMSERTATCKQRKNVFSDDIQSNNLLF